MGAALNCRSPEQRARLPFVPFVGFVVKCDNWEATAMADALMYA